jgi:hypothetical protein
MLEAAITYLEGETGLSHTFFCLYSQAAFEVFVRELASQVGF